MSYSILILVGRLTRDPEARYTAEGVMFTTFSMAVDEGYGDNKHTVWYRVTAWRKTAEIAAQYLKKGSEVLVEGSLQADKDTGNPRIWTDKSGKARASFEITADRIVFLGSRGDSSAQTESTTSDDYSNNIPF